MIVTSHDEIHHAFKLLGVVSHEVMMEQLSKAGRSVKDEMRSSLASTTTRFKTRVGVNGAYLEDGYSREFGLRESMTQDNTDSNPKSMEFAINSFLMEKSSTLVVGGAHPTFTPLKRVDGEVVGTAGRVGKVGRQTIAIIDRMDTGAERGEYPTRSKLGKLTPRNFMTSGILNSSGSVQSYLNEGWVSVMGRAINNIEAEEVIRNYG